MDKKRKRTPKKSAAKSNKKPRQCNMEEEETKQDLSLPQNGAPVEVEKETTITRTEPRETAPQTQTEIETEPEKLFPTSTDASKLVISKRQLVKSITKQQSPDTFTSQSISSSSSSVSFSGLNTSALAQHAPYPVIKKIKRVKEKRNDSRTDLRPDSGFQFQAPPDVKVAPKLGPPRRKLSVLVFPQLVWVFMILAMYVGFSAHSRINEQRIFALEAQLKQCNCYDNVVTQSEYTRISIPVYEDPGSLMALDYLNRASTHFTGGAMSFVVWNESAASHKLGIYAMQYLGRIDSAQEVMMAKMKEAGISNVVLAVMRFMAPNLGERELSLPYDFSGYKCGKKEIATHLELAWYLLSPGNKNILPFVCTDETTSLCDQRNPKQLEKFFRNLDNFYRDC